MWRCIMPGLIDYLCEERLLRQLEGYVSIKRGCPKAVVLPQIPSIVHVQKILLIVINQVLA